MTGATSWWGCAGGWRRCGAGRSLLLLALLLGCAPAGRGARVSAAPWLRADPQRCLLVRDLSEGMEDQARHCAEEFVRANGYTDLPPTDDSTRWVRETDERGPWPVVLAGRIGILERRAAAVQCSVRRCVVLFRLVRPATACGFRIVTMTQVFTRITLHPGGLPDLHCGERRT